MCSSDIAVVQNVFNQQLLENIDWSAEKFAMQGDAAEQDPAMFMDQAMLDILGPSLNITSELEDSISDLITSPEIALAIDSLPSLTTIPLALPVPQLSNNAAEHGSCRTLNTHQTELEAETKWHSLESPSNQHKEGDVKNISDNGNWKLCFDMSKRLLAECSAPDVYQNKGYVPMGCSRFGRLLYGDSVLPFVIGTEFPDPDYGPESSTMEKNLLFFGMANLESNYCSLLYDTEASHVEDEGVKVDVVPNFTVHRLPLRSFQFYRVVRDLAWGPPVSDDSLLVCAASGATVSLFRWEIGRHRVATLLPEVRVHSDIIRSVSIHDNTMASGGFDHQVKLFSLDHLCHTPLPTSTHDAGDVIGCVTWRNAHCVGCSTDGGRMMMVDTRRKPGIRSPLQFHTSRQDLYCHVFHGGVSNHVLLGYGNGTIAQMDIRKPERVLWEAQDPCVQAVGEISISYNREDILTTGTAGFTLWERRGASYGVKASTDISHSGVECGVCTCGGFVPKTSLFALTDSYGMVSVADTHTLLS